MECIQKIIGVVHVCVYKPGDVVLGSGFRVRWVEEVSEEMPRPFGGQSASNVVAYLPPIGAAQLLRMYLDLGL